MQKILVIDDDKVLNRTICEYLTAKGFHADGCYSANDAYNQMYNDRYDVLISDIMMPQTDGFEFARTIRGLDENVPILFISARDDLAYKSLGFEIGIDDYMVKPLSLAELVMRVKALLRRSKIAAEQAITVGNLTLDADAMTAQIGGVDTPVSVREFNILFRLLQNPNKIYTRTQLLDDFWGMDTDSGLRAVDVYITKLRKKFAECDGFEIQTVHGLGYKAVLK